MKFSIALLATILSASEVFAAPGTALRKARYAKRAAGQRGSKPFQSANNTATVEGPDGIDAATQSTNWAGAALVGSGYTGITGTFTVPSVQLPSGGNSGTAYSASAWVGLDGYTCGSAILQTGIDFTLQNGRTTYDAWYEWYPDYAYDFSGISFSAGDSVTVTIKATSKTGGTATVKNNSKGTSVTHTFTGQGASLCETNAEWIVEDFEEISGNTQQQVPFVNFGSVTFTGASASTAGGSVGITNADSVNMISQSNRNEVIAATTIQSSSSVKITYQ
ncbi:MAG: hypothetical protein M1820_006553 [Bogoriella megaspora]|nr:MAG: hypothetical protein M1820_006553 [Bogoriella megaspora]